MTMKRDDSEPGKRDTFFFLSLPSNKFTQHALHAHSQFIQFAARSNGEESSRSPLILLISPTGRICIDFQSTDREKY